MILAGFVVLLVALYLWLSWDRYKFAGMSAADHTLINSAIQNTNSTIRGKYLGRVDNSFTHFSDISYENELFGDEEQ